MQRSQAVGVDKPRGARVMDPSVSMAHTPLPKGALLRFSGVRGHCIAVLRGSVLIKQDGDPHAVTVGAGESLAFDRDGRTLIEARADARLLVLEPHAQSPVAPRPSAEALYHAARRQRAIAVGDLVLRLARWISRAWGRA
jgi:hypothetical protein